MSLNFLQENWEKFAKSDPFWAVLTYSDKKGGKWKIDEFFKTGEEEIRQLMAEIGHHAKNRKRALDFGCGVGRLTQALAQFFQEVTGVDIAPSMIRLANDALVIDVTKNNNADDYWQSFRYSFTK